MRSAQVLKDIVARIDSLDQMMKDMLLFARPPKLKRAPTEVAPLVSMTANLLSQDPALSEIDIEIDGAAPPVSADADMLRIVFQNLLINGAHAMRGKGSIRVAIDTVNSSCQIAFIDQGPGIPRRDPRKDLHTLLHDQGARIGPGAADRQTPDRSPRR